MLYHEAAVTDVSVKRAFNKNEALPGVENLRTWELPEDP